MKAVFFGDGSKILVKDPSKDFHTRHGMIAKESFNKNTGETNKGIKFSIIDSSFVDEYLSLKRGAQIMMLKDIGTIITECGLGKNSVVIDAGSGSGFCAIFLANIVKKVYTYEKDKRQLEIAQKNIQNMKLKNIEIFERDIVEKEFTKKNADCIILDIMEPWRAFNNAEKSLKKGGFLVCYSPHITQSLETVNNAKNFIYIKTLETIKREWVCGERRLRPEFQGLMHTGFITILRKK